MQFAGCFGLLSVLENESGKTSLDLDSIVLPVLFNSLSCYGYRLTGQGRYLPDLALRRLLNLKIARGRKGMAPNKFLLLLAILDLVGAGLVGPKGLVHKDAKLNLRFRSYSPICVRHRGNGIDLALSFRHLAFDGIYVHVGEGERTVRLEPDLLTAMRVPAWRQEVRRRVVATYFPARRTGGPLRGPGDAGAVLGRTGGGPGGCRFLPNPGVAGPARLGQGVSDLRLPLHLRPHRLPAICLQSPSKQPEAPRIYSLAL